MLCSRSLPGIRAGRSTRRNIFIPLVQTTNSEFYPSLTSLRAQCLNDLHIWNGLRFLCVSAAQECRLGKFVLTNLSAARPETPKFSRMVLVPSGVGLGTASM